MGFEKLPRDVVKGLKSWQLYTLATKKEVLGVFMDGLEYGNADSGEFFTSPMKAFFQALRMCGYNSTKLREAYARDRARRQANTSSGNVTPRG